ncbi:hypothetical protein [Stieleria mannarensis]|uniref:hypothetical protein n=1 Tax=Stieleria mannarensis TaxID=2755585 RepID=UPI001601FC15|nr:hypothetical protein [Rhodopirellula sp. JC639]
MLRHPASLTDVTRIRFTNEMPSINPDRFNHLPFRFTRFASVFFVIAVVSACMKTVAAEPILTDDRLQLTLFAEDPQIVTPIGMAIDDRYFKGDEVEAYQALPTSLMPDGLEQLMSVDEFRDLIAYLVTLDD